MIGHPIKQNRDWSRQIWRLVKIPHESSWKDASKSVGRKKAAFHIFPKKSHQIIVSKVLNNESHRPHLILHDSIDRIKSYPNHILLYELGEICIKKLRNKAIYTTIPRKNLTSLINSSKSKPIGSSLFEEISWGLPSFETLWRSVKTS